MAEQIVEKNASLFIIGHEYFNKSLTLDIENRLMHYMMSVERVKHVYNLRDNRKRVITLWKNLMKYSAKFGEDSEKKIKIYFRQKAQ